MGLLVKTLELQDFRSFGEKVVGLAPATTILCGPNAAGKTNTVEALQLLTAGYSFRHPTPAQLVREGAQAARASARLEGDGRVVDLRCDVVSGRRQFFRNGKRVQASEVSGTLMSVLFTPGRPAAGQTQRLLQARRARRLWTPGKPRLCERAGNLHALHRAEEPPAQGGAARP